VAQAQGILVVSLLHLVADICLSGFEFSRIFETQKLNLISCSLVSVFAFTSALPNRLVVGCTNAWRVLSLGAGLGICCISLLHFMTWRYIISMSFVVAVLSGVLHFNETIWLAIILSCVPLSPRCPSSLPSVFPCIVLGAVSYWQAAQL
jgi:hypothetical protein